MITKAQVHEIVEQNRQEAIDCLREIVQTPSVTCEEVAVSKVFERWIKKAGLEPEIIGISPEHPNVLAEWNGSQPGKRFIFNGHMDTFPPTEGDNGLYGPFSGKIVDGYLYGRGSCDMKGGDAAALMAVTFLKKLGFDPKGSIVLSYMCEEEIGGRYGVKWVVRQDRLNGDFGICMEPTNGKVQVGHSGLWRALLTYTAEPASSTYDHPSKNALEKAVIAINALYQYREKVRAKTDPNFGSPSLSITTLHAGKATNVHAAKAQFSIDYRLIPGETHEMIQSEVFAILDGLKQQDPEMDYVYELISDRPVLDVPEDSDIVKACCEAYQEVTGTPAKLYRRHCGTDASTIQGYNGIMMPIWGAADDENEISTPNEKINIKNYLDSIEYYMLAVIKMMG